MANKNPRDAVVWQVDGYLISLDLYNSMIIIQDENGNKIKISKKDPLKIILDLVGSFKTD